MQAGLENSCLAFLAITANPQPLERVCSILKGSMKTYFPVLLLTVFVMLFQSCALKTNHPHSSQPFSIHLENTIVRIQDSTTIILNMADPNDSSLVINWSTNSGTIKAQGAHARYIAPDTKGWAIINAEISDNTHKTYKNSIKIMIYKQLVILKADDVIFDETAIIPTRWKHLSIISRTKT